MQKVTDYNFQKLTHDRPVNKRQNNKQVALKSDAETIAAIDQIEARQDYYHTCINGGY